MSNSKPIMSFLIVAVLAAGCGGTGPAVPDLTAPTAVKAGNLVALQLNDIVRSFAVLQGTAVPTLSAFEPDANRIAIVYFGTAGTIDAAKAVIDNFRSSILEPSLELAGHATGTIVTLDSIVIEYYDTGKQKTLIEYRDGAYSVK